MIHPQKVSYYTFIHITLQKLVLETTHLDMYVLVSLTKYKNMCYLNAVSLLITTSTFFGIFSESHYSIAG